MKLSHLTNKTLLTDIKNLVGNERRATLLILHHLKEIDRRKLYSDLKFSSLFMYCVYELGYSESAAQRRIVAARILRNQPEIGYKIESGLLTLTNISQVVSATKNANEQKKILSEVEGLSKKQCEKKIFEITGNVLPQKESTKRVSENKMKVAIVLTDETFELIEKVKNLSGKNLSTDEVLNFALTVAVEKIEKTKFKQTKARTSPPPAEVKRTVSSKTKREVYLRDKKCSNCGSLKNLNFDHRMPFALGGLSTIDNIRLLCEQCNQRFRMRARLRANPKFNIDRFLKEQECRRPPP